MSNTYFSCKQFTVQQNNCAMKVSTDACIFGAWITAKNNDTTALDIGTGTGLLSLMVAQRFPHLQIDAVEINEEAYQQATSNCTNSKFSHQINVQLSDVKKLATTKQYDFIFSNPPFFENDIATTNVAINLAKHSTALSLQQLMLHATKLLAPNGQLAIIIPSHRCKDAIQFGLNNKLHVQQLLNIQHHAQKPVTKVIQVFGHNKSAVITDNLIIKDMKNNYTADMQQLMDSYYL